MKTVALSLIPLLLSSLSLAAPTDLQKRQYLGPATQNQLTDGTECRQITTLFSRGTTESGNVGTYAGPPFFQAVANKVGASNVAVQGVAYAADVPGFLAGGDVNGAQTMAGLIATAQTQCPNTKLVISGYSQGAQVTHKAAALLTASQAAFVDSVVVFGDPDMGQAVGSIPASKVLTICHVGDDICLGGDYVGPQHLNYSYDAGTAADFVVSQAGS